MAILQRIALYPNERFDTPDARALEAFSQNDWRFFLQGVISDTSYVLSGFEISNYAYVFTSTNVKIRLNNAVVLHPEATTQAVGFYVASGAEADASIILSQSATNFIEADLDAVSGTPDTRAFWDMGANGGAGAEFTDEVDTVINLNLVVSSNISGFTDGKIPLYKVITNSDGLPVSITDCRPLFFRLGTGRSSPNPDNAYSWDNLPDAAHAQFETPNAVIDRAQVQSQPFAGGDKNVKSLKEWMDAIMTSLMKLKASSYWYTPSLSMPEIYQNSTMQLLIGGTWQHSASSPGTLSLQSGTTIYRLGKENNCSLTPFSNLDLAINRCLFVILPSDAAVNFSMAENNRPIVPRATVAPTQYVQPRTYNTITVSPGGNYITTGGNIRIRNQVFSYAAYNASTGLFSGVSPDPTGLLKDTGGDYVYQEANDVNGFYHYGPTSTVPGIVGTVSEGVERVLWLAFYDGVSKIHLKNADLELGEQIQQGDNTSQAILTYIGSTGEADSLPVYNVNSIANGTNLTEAITAAFEIIETPIYDEIVIDNASTGWATNDIVALPPNSRNHDEPASYTKKEEYAYGSTGELQVFENGIFLRVGYDYLEYSNANPATIQLLRDVPPGSYLRFRIANIGGAGAAAGDGLAGLTLNGVYSNGNEINTTIDRPVIINGQYLDDTLFEVNGGVEIAGTVDSTGNILTGTTQNPIPTNQMGLWVDSSFTPATLTLTKEDGTFLRIQEILENLSGEAAVFTRSMWNRTGATIPAGSSVYISASGEIALAHNADEAPARFFGITATSIPNNTQGKVIYNGVVPGIFTGLDLEPGYIWLDSSPGTMSMEPPSQLGSYLVIVGLVDGDDLILQPQMNGRLGLV